MWLHNMTDEEKARAFEYIVKQTEKQPYAIQFGKDVYMILKCCEDKFRFKNS